MATSKPQMLTLSLPADLHRALTTAAEANGWTAESLAIDAIAESLDGAIRYRVLVERMGIVDKALIDIASLVGETAAAADLATGGTGLDIASLCRYKPSGR